MSQEATPKLKSRKVDREMSLALLRRHTRISCGRKAMVVPAAPMEPKTLMIQGGKKLKACILSIAPKEPGGHGKADKDDKASKNALGNHAGEARRRVAPDSAGDHGQQAITPDDLAIDHKENEGNAVCHCGGNYFESVDLIQVLVAKEREQGDHEKDGQPTWWMGEASGDGSLAAFEPAGDWAAGGKDGGSHQQQPGNHVEKGQLWRVKEDQGAGCPAEQAGEAHGQRETHVFPDVVAVCGD